MIFGMFNSQSYYLPFGIGTAIGVIASFLVSYALNIK